MEKRRVDTHQQPHHWRLLVGGILRISKGRGSLCKSKNLRVEKTQLLFCRNSGSFQKIQGFLNFKVHFTYLWLFFENQGPFFFKSGSFLKTSRSIDFGTWRDSGRCTKKPILLSKVGEVQNGRGVIKKEVRGVIKKF